MNVLYALLLTLLLELLSCSVPRTSASAMTSANRIKGFDLSSAHKGILRTVVEESRATLMGGDFDSKNRREYDFMSNLNDEGFWRSLAPRLHIYDRSLLAASSDLVVEISAQEADQLRHLIITEGYLKLDSVFPNDESLVELRAVVNKLHSLHIPIQFVFLYDEAWLLFMRLHSIISAVMGQDYRRLPDFWAWRVDPQADESGWSLHRDKSGMPRDALIDRDSGLPNSLSVWVSLSDATPLNSCMNVLPADRDPCYESMCDLIGNHSHVVWPRILQNFRALPVKPGSVLMWNQVVYHYGSRSSPRANIADPRISLSIEFQASRTPPLNHPMSNPLKLPKFKVRLLLLMKQFIQYKHMYYLEPEIEKMARDILDLQLTNEDSILSQEEY